MNARKILVFLAVSAVIVALIKQLAEQSQKAGNTAKPEPEIAPIVSVVAETLHKHEGEDSPIVHAFEEALEHETKHED